MIMERILITGGTGKLGSEVAKTLQDLPYLMSILTTRNNHSAPDNVSYIARDLTQITTLKPFSSQFDIIIHCASNPRDSYSVDVCGTQNLLKVFGDTIKHLIYISIVGVNRGTSQYYQDKFRVEQQISNSHIPFTIVRATQFHDLVLDRIIRPNEENEKIKVPKGLKFQTIDTSDVTSKILEILKGKPTQSIVNIGGQELLTLEEMTLEYTKVFYPGKKLEEKEELTDFEKIFTTGINLCPENKYGRVFWKDFLNRINNHSF
jgi:uncharacterized protein YbjT (DUF2867 family)